jgi:hypothetical protein
VPPLVIDPDPHPDAGGDGAADASADAMLPPSDFRNPPALPACGVPDGWYVTSREPCGPTSPCAIYCFASGGSMYHAEECVLGDAIGTPVTCVTSCEECR